MRNTYAPWPAEIVFGKTDLTRDDEIGQDDRIASEVFIHPQFLEWTNANDIALIKLREELVFSDKIQPLELTQVPVSPRESALIFEWQMDDVTNKHRCLQTSESVVLSDVECNQFLSTLNSSDSFDGKICSTPTDSKNIVCPKDAGILVGKDDNGTYRLVGVSSWGSICEVAHTGIGMFSDVYQYVDWITEITREPIHDDWSNDLKATPSSQSQQIKINYLIATILIMQLID